jgi:TUP1-like enhancer of split
MFKNNNNKPLWETYLGSSIRCLAANRKLLVVCNEDRGINSYCLKSGARALPTLIIEDLSVAVHLSENNHCLVLTRTGLLHMWNFESKKAILNRISIRSLLFNKGSLLCL